MRNKSFGGWVQSQFQACEKEGVCAGFQLPSRLLVQARVRRRRRGRRSSRGRVSPVLVKVVYQKLASKKSCFIYLGGGS